jgi:hypothetical protein
MRRPHEVPTHLNVEDKLLFGLTVRQFLYVLVGSSVTYTLWEQTSGSVDVIRVCLASVCVLVTLAFALLRPADRPLEEWLAAALVYLSSPRRSIWRPDEPEPGHWRPASGGWEELAPSLSWAEDEGEWG